MFESEKSHRRTPRNIVGVERHEVARRSSGKRGRFLVLTTSYYAITPRDMARKFRVEYLGTNYHVMSRGDQFRGQNKLLTRRCESPDIYVHGSSTQN